MRLCITRAVPLSWTLLLYGTENQNFADLDFTRCFSVGIFWNNLPPDT